MRAIREALLGLWRAPLLGGLAVTAIGFSLYIVGLFGVTAHNIDRALSEVESQVEVVGYLRESAGPERTELARKEISAYPEVERVRYVSKVEALRAASRELPEFSDVFSELEVNPLPASLEVRLVPAHRDRTTVEEVAERIRSYDFIEEVRYGREWMERIFSLRRMAGIAATVLGGAFALVAIMLVGTAVRMGIFARSDAIDIMQTVGATPGYIRRPFLLEGLITGSAGGVLALVFTYATYRAVDAYLLSLAWVPDSWVLGGLVAAAVLGMLAAARAVHRELDDLYDL